MQTCSSSVSRTFLTKVHCPKLNEVCFENNMDAATDNLFTKIILFLVGILVLNARIKDGWFVADVCDVHSHSGSTTQNIRKAEAHF